MSGKRILKNGAVYMSCGTKRLKKTKRAKCPLDLRTERLFITLV